ncbi:MAG: radical SAM protein [Clostridia bacterium]|nr:radical SAM protein [Clostridia bacterium]
MRFAKAYVEISNICNLSCSFCPGTSRTPRRMSVEEFSTVLDKLEGYVEYLYFHLLGEPLCHPELEAFLTLAQSRGFKVTLTTNGTLIDKRAELLLRLKPYKIVFSLHSFEANSITSSLEKYLENCFAFGKGAEGESIVVYRLWNNGGSDSLNSEIEERLSLVFPRPWLESRNGVRIGDKAFLQYGDKFDWPDITSGNESETVFCYGLRDQIGILADGTVVPCCLDNNGTIALGNIFETSFDEILSTPRAKAIYEGFSRRNASEPLCRRCSYARRFK